ncbi:stage II sporulation protein M [Herbinix luporum]|uniref:stage II sporulation protein M n=1 Tax=Herbinix luporum TaxID=1679721 RepID=UPI0017694705|nr:stage II sporulation protein M [Herbinix luporum]MDI9488677.1 stage II sporulation protein M [Bacillota bacterium]HHT56740.1 hypothetical protein [Herbinix luporum]
MKHIKIRVQSMSLIQISILLMILGVFFGVLFANIFQSSYYDRMMNYHNLVFTEIVREDIDYTGLFLYVLNKNFKEFIVFWLISITILGIPYMIFKLLTLGFSMGFFISAIAMQYGFKGILLILSYGFPHGLIYIPLIILCLYKGYSLCVSIYYDKRNYAGTIMEHIKSNIFVLIFLAVLLLLGSFLEAYVGSFFLKKTLVFYIN